MSVLLAVSGGRDSVTLAHVLTRLAETRWSRLRLSIAHFNHQARGRASDEDERFVRELSARLGLPFHCGRRDVTAEALRGRKNFEETARLARYQFLRDCAAGIGADRIATGHTVSDQAETVLMRLIRGTGTEGLSAIRPMLEGLIIRPLIEVTREEISEACSREHWSYREDASNFDRTRLRNRIRADLLPLCRSMNARVEAALGRAALSAQGDEAYFDQVVSNLQEGVIISKSAREVWVSGARLRQLHSALGRRILRNSVRHLRGDGRTIDTPRLHAILGLLSEGPSGRRLEVGGGIEVWSEFGDLRFTKAPGIHQSPPDPVPVIEGKPARFGAHEVILSRCAMPLAQGSRPGEHFRHFLDARVDRLGLVVRARRPGDAFVPQGHTGSHRVKDLMISARIPASRRAIWPLLAAGSSGEVLCAPGLPANREFAPSGLAQVCFQVDWKSAGAALD